MKLEAVNILDHDGKSICRKCRSQRDGGWQEISHYNSQSSCEMLFHVRYITWDVIAVRACAVCAASRAVNLIEVARWKSTPSKPASYAIFSRRTYICRNKVDGASLWKPQAHFAKKPRFFHSLAHNLRAKRMRSLSISDVLKKISARLVVVYVKIIRWDGNLSEHSSFTTCLNGGVTCCMQTSSSSAPRFVRGTALSSEIWHVDIPSLRVHLRTDRQSKKEHKGEVKEKQKRNRGAAIQEKEW